MLRKGNAYAYQVLSDRAFGKLKETHALEHSVYKDQSDEDLEKKIKEIEIRLGYRPREPEAEPKVLPPADDTKPN
jgi:hypothetical protein